MKKFRVLLIFLIIFSSLVFAANTKSIESRFPNRCGFVKFYDEQIKLYNQFGWDEAKFREENIKKNGPKDDVIGQQRTFIVNSSMNAEGTGSTIVATCRGISANAVVYVSNSQWTNNTVNQAFVNNILDAWENHVPANQNKGIYQMNTELFGTPPDVDGNPKIYILIFNITQGVLGYFSPVNEYPNYPGSNGMEILHIDSNSVGATDPLLLATVAHEFQHMIHFNNNASEDLWVNEGCSMYAEIYCGWYSGTVEYINSYANNPNIQLNAWNPESGSSSAIADYGKACLFMMYLAEHYGGSGAVGAVAQHPQTGFSGIITALQQYSNTTDTFPVLFRKWIIANYLDNPSIYNGIYGYPTYNFGQFASTSYSSPNQSGSFNIYPYGTKYLKFQNFTGPLTVQFNGQDDKIIEIFAIKYVSNTVQEVEQVNLNSTYDGTYNVNMDNYQKVVFAITNRKTTPAGTGTVEFTSSSSGGGEVVTLFQDNFDSYPNGDLDIGNWVTYDGDQQNIGGINGFSFPHQGEKIAWTVVDWSGTNITAHSGTKTVATMYNANGQANNDWLISPPISLTSSKALSSAYLSFWTRILTTQYGPEHIFVKLSPTGGTNPSDFTVQLASITLNTPAVWEEQNINLNSYIGQTVRIAIQYDAEYIFTVLVDDFSVKGMTGGSSVTYPITIGNLQYQVGTYYNNSKKIAQSPTGEIFAVMEGEITGHAVGADILFTYSADGQSFTAPVCCSGTTVTADKGRAAIAYDPAHDIIYVAWHQNTYGSGSTAKYQIFVSYSTNKGVTWSTPEKISDAPIETGNYGFPALTVDANGTVFCAWNKTGTNGICVDKKPYNGSWGTDVEVATTNSSALPSIATNKLSSTGAGTAWIAFTETIGSGSTAQMNVWAFKYDGTSTTTPELVAGYAVDQFDAFRASIAVDNNNLPHVVFCQERTYSDGTNTSYYYCIRHASRNASGTWTVSPNYVSGPAETDQSAGYFLRSFNPVVGWDNNGNLHVSFVVDKVNGSTLVSDVYASTSIDNGATWIINEEDNNITNTPTVYEIFPSISDISWDNDTNPNNLIKIPLIYSSDMTYNSSTGAYTGPSKVKFDYYKFQRTGIDGNAQNFKGIISNLRNYPNPFNPTTTISFSLAKAGRTEVIVYNISGQVVKVLSNENREAGSHSIVWDGKDSKGNTVSSGIYFYKVSSNNEVRMGKMLLVK